jgi:hypothetical protein
MQKTCLICHEPFETPIATAKSCPRHRLAYMKLKEKERKMKHDHSKRGKEAEKRAKGRIEKAMEVREIYQRNWFLREGYYLPCSF